MLNGYSPEQAFEALLTIPATIDHDTRARIGMAAKDAGVSFDDYDAWQSANPRYDQLEVKAMWRSYGDGAVKAGTLFGIAKEHGWTPNGASHFEVHREQDRATRQPEPPRKPAAGQGPDDVWVRLRPDTNQHPYALRKKLCDETLSRLRVVPATDQLTQYRGWLAVPGYAADGGLQTIEFVAADGIKRTLKDTTKVSAMFTVGPDHGHITVVEGVGAADAAYASTGGRAVSTFGCGNTRRVVEALRQKEPHERITIAPDRGQEAKAFQIAAEFNCSVACVPETETNNTDLNDIFVRDGFDQVQAILEAATEPPKPEPLLKPVSVFDVLTHPSPPPAFVWADYLPRTEVALLSAHGGTGKSTIALMLAVCAVLGRPLFGVDTEQCNVVFVSLEDGPGIVRHRLASICRAWLIDPMQLHGRLHIVDGTSHPELFTAESKGMGDVTSTYAELRALVQAEAIGLVLIDNASDAFAGDEIQRKQVRGFIRKLKEIAKATSAAVMLLSHVDKGTSRARKAEGGEGYSGSTAWHNSVRSRLFLSRAEDGLLTLEHQKSNLGRMRDPLTLEWLEGGFPQVVQAGGFDADGFSSRQQGRVDDDKAIALMKLMAEFESRGQYCSTSTTARNNVYGLLRSEPGFQSLKLNADAVKRIVNQCQRAGWIDQLEYRNAERKVKERWTVTADGREFAGLCATTSESAPPHNSAPGASGAPTCAPPHTGGTGEESAHSDGAETEMIND